MSQPDDAWRAHATTRPWHALAIAAAMIISAFAMPTPAVAEMRGVIFVSGGGAADDPYNKATRRGAALAAETTGIDFELVYPNQLGWPPETWAERLAAYAAQGREPVIAMGFQFAEAIQTAASRHPDHAFAAIDAEIDASNVISLLFRAEEGSFLVGALAARMSEAGRIGFIGGMPDPLIDAFFCGFKQGARHLRPGVAIDFAHVAQDPRGFNLPEEGARLAQRMLGAGADVLFHAAGRSGNGVIAAAKASNRYAIGVDVDQHDQAPGHVLTSMVKRVDIAILHAVERFAAGERGGVVRLGLDDRGVDWVYGESNWDIVPQAAFEEIENLKQQVIFGDIVVSEGPLGAEGCSLVWGLDP